jgi:hypothetical protein
MDKQPTFEEIKASILQGFEESKANRIKVEQIVAQMSTASEVPEVAKVNDMLRAFAQQIMSNFDYYDRQMQYIYKMIDEHSQGHLPKINSSVQMKKAIGNLGLGDEYDVAKKVVYARSTRGGETTAVIDFHA